MTAEGKVTFTSETQAENLRVTNIQLSKVPNHKYCNQLKCITYMQEYDILGVDQFKAYLQENYDLADVTKAHLIKTKSLEIYSFTITLISKKLLSEITCILEEKPLQSCIS